MEERLQKILAHAGLGSRRACEDLISAGRVTVNGQVATLGSKADVKIDRVAVDGKVVKLPESYQYIALYKPRGVISAVTSPDPRKTVIDLVPDNAGLYPVGRLDVDSEGLILLTNDGDLANKLTHPRYGHEKEYRVLVARHPDDKQLSAWQHGVVMEDGYRTAPAQVRVEVNVGKGTWIRVIMKEGRKRQIRETCAQIGLPVVRIIRNRISSLRLGNLKPGESRHLTTDEVSKLKTGPSQKPVSNSRQNLKTRSPKKKPIRKS
jgi:23S rRNA pseudouridine2605 synthase